MSLKASRTDPDAVPNLELSAQTHGLNVRIERDQQPTLALSGIELRASATHDGVSGNTSLALGADQGSVRLLSGSADLSRLSASANLL